MKNGGNGGVVRRGCRGRGIGFLVKNKRKMGEWLAGRNRRGIMGWYGCFEFQIGIGILPYRCAQNRGKPTQQRVMAAP